MIKRMLALTLAVALVLSLSALAYATEYTEGYFVDTISNEAGYPVNTIGEGLSPIPR